MSRVESRWSPAALAHALDETTRTVVRVVRRENSLHGFTTVLGGFPHPIPENLQQALLGLVDGLTDRAYGDVLTTLFRSGSQGALAKAREGLRRINTRACRNRYLPTLTAHGENVWRAVIARMQRDPGVRERAGWVAGGRSLRGSGRPREKSRAAGSSEPLCHDAAGCPRRH